MALLLVTFMLVIRMNNLILKKEVPKFYYKIKGVKTAIQRIKVKPNSQDGNSRTQNLGYCSDYVYISSAAKLKS